MRFDPSKNLTDSEIRARINAAAGESDAPSPSLPGPSGSPVYRFADPISSATQPLLDVLQHDDETFEFGGAHG